MRFTLGASLYGHEVALFINSPPVDDVPFVRTVYRQLKWQYHFAEYADEGNAFVDCRFSRAGSFRFFFSLDGRLACSVRIRYVIVRRFRRLWRFAAMLSAHP